MAIAMAINTVIHTTTIKERNGISVSLAANMQIIVTIRPDSAYRVLFLPFTPAPYLKNS